MDALPVISQLKSLVQVTFGDAKGAKITQENFSKQCLVVSQIRSIVEASLGDCEAADRTQKECGYYLLSVVEGLPIVGHAIGAGYYIAKRNDLGDNAMKSASRTTGVIGGGILGFLAGGPVGALIGGSSGGLALDGVTTGVESAIHKKFKPHGVLLPFNDVKNPGKWADSVFLILLDGLTGRLSGKVVGRMIAGEAVVPVPLEEQFQGALSRSNGITVSDGLSPVLTAIGAEIYNVSYKFVTKYKAQIFESFQKFLDYIVGLIKKEFHSLLNPMISYSEPLKPKKLKKIENHLLKPKGINKKEPKLNEVNYSGRKYYIYDQEVPAKMLKRSHSCYF